MKKTKSSNLTLTAAAPDTGRLTGADRIAISLIPLLMSLGCALVLAALFAAPSWRRMCDGLRSIGVGL